MKSHISVSIISIRAKTKYRCVRSSHCCNCREKNSLNESWITFEAVFTVQCQDPVMLGTDGASISEMLRFDIGIIDHKLKGAEVLWSLMV
jgi:hypothetical protein